VAQYFFYGSNRPPQVKQYFLQKPRLCREWGSHFRQLTSC
jgi:hypothetical protein